MDLEIKPLDSRQIIRPGSSLRLKRFFGQPKFQLVAIVLFVVLGGGVLALTQRFLNNSQDSRSDAAQNEVKIWAGFMSDPVSPGAPPQGLSSTNISSVQPTEVGIWLNNPTYQQIGALSLYVEFDPAAISLDTFLVPQSGLTENQQPKTLREEINSSNGKKIEVLALVAKCTTNACHPLRNTGSQWIKIAKAQITPTNSFMGQTQVKIMTSADNSRSLVLGINTDENVLQSGGYTTLNLNSGASASVTAGPTINSLAKVANLTLTPNCADKSIQLAWDPLQNASSYHVQYCTGSQCANWTTLQNSLATTSYEHTDLASRLYRYRVRGKAGSVLGAWSDIKQARISDTCAPTTPIPTATVSPTQTPNQLPTKVMGLTVTPFCGINVNRLSWIPSTNATGYVIGYCAGENCINWSNLAQNHPQTNFEHANLPSALYRYRVRAKNAVGVGPWSDIGQGIISATCPTDGPLPSETQEPSPTADVSPTEEALPSPTSAPLAGDFDGDGRVSLAELRRVMQAYGQSGDSPENVNADNEVDLLDVTIVLANFLR